MAASDVGKQKNLDQEVRELISALSNRVHSIKPGGSSSTMALSQDDHEDGPGVRFITLAGSNVGATMRGQMDEKPAGNDFDDDQSMEHEDFVAHINSNFQAINNSIMLDGRYESSDPGVHLDVVDYVDKHGSHEHGKKGRKHRRGRTSDHEDSDRREN